MFRRQEFEYIERCENILCNLYSQRSWLNHMEVQRARPSDTELYRDFPLPTLENNRVINVYDNLDRDLHVWSVVRWDDGEWFIVECDKKNEIDQYDCGNMLNWIIIQDDGEWTILDKLRKTVVRESYGLLDYPNQPRPLKRQQMEEEYTNAYHLLESYKTKGRVSGIPKISPFSEKSTKHIISLASRCPFLVSLPHVQAFNRSMTYARTTVPPGLNRCPILKSALMNSTYGLPNLFSIIASKFNVNICALQRLRLYALVRPLGGDSFAAATYLTELYASFAPDSTLLGTLVTSMNTHINYQTIDEIKYQYNRLMYCRSANTAASSFQEPGAILCAADLQLKYTNFVGSDGMPNQINIRKQLQLSRNIIGKVAAAIHNNACCARARNLKLYALIAKHVDYVKHYGPEYRKTADARGSETTTSVDNDDERCSSTEKGHTSILAAALIKP